MLPYHDNRVCKLDLRGKTQFVNQRVWVCVAATVCVQSKIIFKTSILFKLDLSVQMYRHGIHIVKKVDAN